jgi:capsular exopolysaccharide synthesis family protein
MFKKKTKHESKSTLLITNPKQKNNKIDYKEIYRHIRTNIEYSTVGQNIKTINITSAVPTESKSTTALNLSMIYATKYPKILLIDADLRKPVQHKYLNISNSAGLTNALIDFGKTKQINQSYFQKIKDSSFVSDLTVLTSGVKVPNPSELLSNPVFEDFIKKLKESYDFIIIDCPPVMMVSDAIPVGNVVDGTIFVCSSKSTNRKAAVEVLQKNNVNIIGTLLTQVENGGTNSGYYYYYYY